MPTKSDSSSADSILHQQCRWHAYPATAALESAAALTILDASQQAISTRGAFHIVLAGGTTPRRVYELLRGKPADWQKWHIYFGDERCLPADHAERNSHMAAEAWLKHVNIPATQIHDIPAELGSDTAASTYTQILSRIDLFDLVLLGLGEDGHTASLFPNYDWGITPESQAAIAVHNAPKPPAERVSLSARRLSQTRQLIFLVTGISKKQAIRDWLDGKVIPATAITPACGVDIYLDNSIT